MKVRVIHQGKVHEFDDPELMVVEDAAGSPVAVAAQTGVPGTFLVSSIDDDVRFNHVLRGLGLDRTVFVRPVKVKPLG